MQNASPDKRLCVCYFLLFTSCWVGCHTQQPKIFDDLFSGEDTSYKSQYGQTPAQRVEELRTLASNAGSLTVQQRTVAAEKITQEIVTESDPLMRRELVATLGVFADAQSLSALHAAMADPEPIVRIAACEAWSRLLTEEAFAVLVHTMSTDSSVEVRQAATRALGRFKSAEAMRVLATALDDKDPATQLVAIRSLELATGKRLGTNATKWREYVATAFGPPADLDQVNDNRGSEMMTSQPSDNATWRQ